MSMPHYCMRCLSELVNGVCPDCSQEPTTTSNTSTPITLTDGMTEIPPPAATDTPRILHCDNCGDSYYDSGFSVGCPLCKLAASEQRCERLEKAFACSDALASALADEFEEWAKNPCRGHVADPMGFAKLVSRVREMGFEVDGIGFALCELIIGVNLARDDLLAGRIDKIGPVLDAVHTIAQSLRSQIERPNQKREERAL